MEVPRLTAIQFWRPLHAGRTQPLLIGAADAGGQVHEVVLKPRGPELGVHGQIIELAAVRLAALLGLHAARPVIVEVTPEFAAAVPAPCGAALSESLGENFGTHHLGTGFTTWPIHRGLAAEVLDQAAAIYAFDLLVQNAHRRAPEPNVWARSGHLGVYDHEQAFTFLLQGEPGGRPQPWGGRHGSGGFRFLESHVFHAALRGRPFRLDRFQAGLAALGESAIAHLLEPLPKTWLEGPGGGELRERLAIYLREAHHQRELLTSFVHHLLR